jgi:hypothetical protein
MWLIPYNGPAAANSSYSYRYSIVQSTNTGEPIYAALSIADEAAFASVLRNLPKF